MTAFQSGASAHIVTAVDTGGGVFSALSSRAWIGCSFPYVMSSHAKKSTRHTIPVQTILSRMGCAGAGMITPAPSLASAKSTTRAATGDDNDCRSSDFHSPMNYSRQKSARSRTSRTERSAASTCSGSSARGTLRGWGRRRASPAAGTSVRGKRQVSDRTGASGGVGLGETSDPIG